MHLRPLKDGPHLRKGMVFHGKVQQVGFRYEVMSMARDLELTGFVQNLASGAVRLEVQGPEGDIVQLLRALNNVPRFRIDAIDEKVLPIKKGEQGFRRR